MDIAEPLQALLARELAGFRALDLCRQLSAGASQETWQIGCETAQGLVQLALRSAPPGVDRALAMARETNWSPVPPAGTLGNT